MLKEEGTQYSLVTITRKIRVSAIWNFDGCLGVQKSHDERVRESKVEEAERRVMQCILKQRMTTWIPPGEG